MQIVSNFRRAGTICAFSALLISATACKKTRMVQPAEYEVLSAFIDSEFAGRKGVTPIAPEGNGITRIVISSMSESDQEGMNAEFALTADSLRSEAAMLKRETIDGFQDVNKQQGVFQRSFRVAFDYELLDSSQLESAFKDGSWTAYYKRFPGSPGVLRFSRVGFSADGNQALFCVSNQCGALCGGGDYVIMGRHQGRWVIEKTIDTWVS